MLTSSFSGDLINSTLRQMGATSIREVRNGILCMVKFELDQELTVSYVFNVTAHGKYFLQRVEPYAMSHGKFETAADVIHFIHDDVEKFKTAKRSHNFPTFLQVSGQLEQFTHALELLFLERNVSAEDLADVQKYLADGMEKLKQIHTKAPRVEHKQGAADII